MNDEIRIYVADLAAYNNGKLHGVWIDVCEDIEQIQAQVFDMLENSPEPGAEEYAIHDYEGFGAYRLGEFAGLETAHKIACFFTVFPAFGDLLLDYFGGDLDEAETAAGEQYAGCYSSLSEYAESLYDGVTIVPEALTYYIDYERLGRDMELGGDIFTLEVGHESIHIFWSQ